jgi:PAS domain-containing protein
MQPIWMPSDRPDPAAHGSAADHGMSTASSRPTLRPDEELFETYRRVVKSMARPAERRRLIQLITEEAARLLRSTAAALYAVDRDDRSALRTVIGAGSHADREGELLPLEGSFVGSALLSREPQHTADLTSDPRAYPPREGAGEHGPALVVPLGHEEVVLAVLLVGRPRGAEDFSEFELDLLLAASDVFSAALTNATTFDRARNNRAELEAWRREVELQSWNSAYEAAAQTNGRVIFRWHLDSGTFHWAKTLEQVLGYRADEFGATLEQWVEHIVAEDRTALLQEFRRARQEGQALELRLRLQHRSGAVRQVVLRTLSPEDASSPIRIGILEDVTDRERQATHRDQKARADAASEIIRALRHEINNPLAVVIGQIQLLQQDPAVTGNPTLEQSLQAIHEESVRMHDLVRRLAALEQYPRAPFVTRSGGVNIPGEVTDDQDTHS